MANVIRKVMAGRQECHWNSSWEITSVPQSRMQRGVGRERERQRDRDILDLASAFGTSKPTDTPPSPRPRLLILSKQFKELGTKLWMPEPIGAILIQTC